MQNRKKTSKKINTCSVEIHLFKKKPEILETEQLLKCVSKRMNQS